MKKTVSHSHRRYLRGAALGRLGFCTSWAVDSPEKKMQWLEIVHHDLFLPNLADVFRGKRVVLVSDLHCSTTVSSGYLSRCVDRINHLDPDIVLLAGDYITCDITGRFREKLVKLLTRLKSRNGIYACLGNHDYGVDGLFTSVKKDTLYEITDGLTAIGINVLRNSAHVWEIDGRAVSFVGLGDLWAGDFYPEAAFEGIHDTGVVIALAHNPKSIKGLVDFNFDAVMCGHTHGLAVQLAPSFGWPYLNRHYYHAGMYHIGHRKLYVNRGLGRLGKALFNARPEITIFNLC